MRIVSNRSTTPKGIARAAFAVSWAAALSSCISVHDVEVEVQTPLARLHGATSEGTETAERLVARLDFRQFRSNVSRLARFGSRYYSNEGNLEAGNWIEDQLRSYGYEVERHAYEFRGVTRENVYATKVGVDRPDTMYIVSAHMDSFNTEDRSGEFVSLRRAPRPRSTSSGARL